MDHLSSAAIEWALTHITKFGDTDIFPVPFEFDCIKHGWNSLRLHLEKQDLTRYRVRGSRRMLVPKSWGGYRVATQLDPLDAIIYAALSYELAPIIEKARIPQERKISCSYRVDLDPSGRLFAGESGWSDYHDQSKELTSGGSYSYVFLADIADFYNQVYSHRISSALEAAGVSAQRATNVESFLLQLTAKQTRGLPVGPSTSILLAEALLTDVDSLLLRMGLPFTRYVDDFRIFCRSRREAVRVHHDLTEYLYTAHRLVLQPWKTRIMPIASFREKELIDPAETETTAMAVKVRQLLEEILAQSGYTIGEHDLLSEDKDRVVRENLVELFGNCVSSRPLHLGLARYLLRRASRLRTVVLNQSVFDNLERLRSVFRETMQYVSASVPKKSAAQRGAELVEFLNRSDYGQLQFLRLWGIETLYTRPDMLPDGEAFDLATAFERDLGTRPIAMMAKRGKRLDWVRGLKESWANYGPWDRRAIIYAGSVLPSGEKKAWLGLVEESTEDPLERVVAQYAMTN